MHLHLPRLTFSGDFVADVSTVNNDVRHYDNATFEPRFQQPSDGQNQNGWWNPEGGASFDLVGCTVRSAQRLDGTTVSDLGVDSAVGGAVTGPADRAGGKMVDIDPQAQMYSQLWGVTLRLSDGGGGLLLQGDLVPPSFRDLQVRQFDLQGGTLTASGAPNGQPSGASWTSVLTAVQWGSGSPAVDELRAATDGGLVAVNLVAFGYYYAHADGRFGMGRLLGTLGPHRAGEPLRFPAGRRLFGPGPILKCSTACFEPDAGRVSVDLGGSLPLDDSMGTPLAVGAVTVAVAKGRVGPLARPQPLPPDAYETIGVVDPGTDASWLLRTSGVVTFPVNAAAADLLPDHQLLLLTGGGGGGNATVWACEPQNGRTVRADETIQRLDPGKPTAVHLHVQEWGRPAAGVDVVIAMAAAAQDGGGGNGAGSPPARVPFTNQPASALTFSSSVTTDVDGVAVLDIAGSDPGNPRGYVDGQIYQLNYRLADQSNRDRDSFDQIVVHLRDVAPMPDRPTFDDIRDTLVQFGNLYPVMSRHLVDLADEQAVRAHRRILLHAFRQDLDAPDHMPVTRDLSAAKRDVIVRWLEQQPDELLPMPDEEAVAEPPVPSRQGAPTEPDPSELLREPAITMTRSQYESMTDGEGGKIDALRNLGESVGLIEDEG